MFDEDKPKQAARAQPGQRFPETKQQEIKSRSQFAERLVDHGWAPQGFELDLGEDKSVQIFAKGKTVGLAFDVQLKSTADLSSYALKTKTGTISYSFEVKDLDHWSRSTRVVILVVWDVSTRNGVWCEVKEAIRRLRHEDPDWRKGGGSVAVHFPREQDLSDDGLERIRHLVAERNLPLAPKGGRFGARIEVEPVGAGIDVAARLESVLEEGGEITISPEYVKSFRTPRWFARWFGEPTGVSLTISSSLPKKRFIRDFECAAGEMAGAVRHVRLRYVRAGRSRVVLSNQDQKHPIEVVIEGDRLRKSGNINFKMCKLERTVEEAREVTAFMLARALGGELRTVDPATRSVTSISGASASALDEAQMDWLRGRLAFFEAACRLQNHYRHCGTFSLSQGVSAGTVHRVARLDELITRGSATVRWNGWLKVDRLPQSTVDSIRMRRQEFRVLGVTIPIDLEYHIIEPERFAEAYEAAAAKGGETVEILLKDLLVKLTPFSESMGGWSLRAATADASGTLT